MNFPTLITDQFFTQDFLANVLKINHEKHKLFKKYLINRTPEHETNYRNYGNKLRAIIKKAEIKYYRKIFDQKENSIKNPWKHLWSFLNSPRKNTKVDTDKLLVNGKKLTNKKDIANSLNSYFINIDTQLATKVKTFITILKSQLRIQYS